MKSRASLTLLILAALMLLLYEAAESAGLRETMSLLTRMDVLSDPPLRDLAGLALFLASYALAFFVAPVLVIAAALRLLIARRLPGDAPAKAADEPAVPERPAS